MTSKHYRLLPREPEDYFKDAFIALRSEMHDRTVKAVLNHLFWQWTVRDGKILKCKFRSREAGEHLATLPCDAFQSRKKELGLIHEHVVPRSVVVEFLLSRRERVRKKRVRMIFERVILGAVVTLEEDKQLRRFKSTMPAGFKLTGDLAACDPWMRYRACGIPVVDRDGNRVV